MELVTGMLLVVLGAILSLFATRFSSWRENQSRRNLLIGMLKYELRRVKERFPEYDANKVFHRDPLRFASVGKLLDVLNYKHDSVLIQELLFFRIAIARYNDFISVSNHAQCHSNMPDEAHREVFNNIAEYHHLVCKAKERIVPLLPPKIPEVGRP